MFPEEGLDAEHLRRVMDGYRARVIAESENPEDECPYSKEIGGSFYFMWMNGWNKADSDLNYG